MPPTPHFAPAALKFLRGIKRNNDREWFEPRKPIYESELKQPMLSLIEAINAEMADFAPAHVRPAHKILMRLYRDVRFSADKRPYKSHIAAWWSREGMEKTSGGGYYLHLSATEIIIAAGVYMPQREQLFAIRTYLLDHHEEMRAILADKKLKSLMPDFEGNPLTRSPKGFPADHPAADLLLCRQWGLSATLPADLSLQPDLLREVVSRFRVVSPFVDRLNAPFHRAKSTQKSRY
ncbi:MAG: DUF2461 domain-containing protein [Acidobacteriaceae bacterium]